LGSLIYLAKCTRSDISFAIGKAAKNAEEPTITDWKKVNKQIQISKHYLKIIKIIYNGIEKKHCLHGLKFRRKRYKR